MKRWLAALFLTPVLWGQVERASIVGTVADKTGAVVPDAAVRVTHESTNTSIEVRTGEAGSYSAPNLVPGSYTVTVQKQVFHGR